MSEQQESDAELYIRLMPYILRDFSTRKDITALLSANALINRLFFHDTSDSSEGIKQATYYKELIENGADDLYSKVKPVIDI